MSASLAAQENGDFRILVIDDNVQAHEAISSLLQLQGYAVCTAADAAAGLVLMRSFQPHLVLSDIGLPGMSGYQLAPALRNSANGRKIVIAAVTGYGFASDVARIKEAGFDSHFVKPMDADVLLDYVYRQREAWREASEQS